MRPKTIKKFLGLLASIFIVQTLTFYLYSFHLLENKLLPVDFQMTHDSDSAFVRDFYITDCNVGSFFTPLSHDLKNSEDELRSKLGVKALYFAQRGTLEYPEEKCFNLVYHTWARRWDWITLSSFFQMQQVEELIVHKNTIYTREVTYQWCLFFWVKTFEFVSRDSIEPVLTSQTP